MRILFVSSESPLYPAGGIGTYLDYIAPALVAAGHEIFLFTWRPDTDKLPAQSFGAFRAENVHIEKINADHVHHTYPSRSHFQSMSCWISERLRKVVADWQIDVVEATDYQAPGWAYFTDTKVACSATSPLLVTYHHGLSEVMFEADQIGYPEWARADNLQERQQMRASDLVIAPSMAINHRLQSLDISVPVEVVREPFLFRMGDIEPSPIKPLLQYMDRISIQKGADKLILLANILNSILPLERIELIGKIGFTSFKQPNIEAYIRGRISPQLRSKLTFLGQHPREEARNLLTAGSISPHLGTDETFSYACAEAIDADLLPIVRNGTAMAEFFPNDLQMFVLDEKLSSVKSTADTIEKIVENADHIRARVREHCKSTLSPARVAHQLSDAYDKALRSKRERKAYASRRPAVTVSDVTILIPAFGPDSAFMETVDSIANQTCGVPHVIICDDGTPQELTHWFEYARARLPECRIVRQPNSGLLAARNTLIEECATKYSIFLDTDDILAPDFILNMLNAKNNLIEDVDAIIPQRCNFDESDEVILRHLFGDYMHMIENDYRMTALIRTEVVRAIGFDSTRRNGEADDWAFWIDFTLEGYSAALLNEASFAYRFRSGSMSWPWSEGQRVGTQSMLRERLQHVSGKPGKVHALARALFMCQVSK